MFIGYWVYGGGSAKSTILGTEYKTLENTHFIGYGGGVAKSKISVMKMLLLFGYGGRAGGWVSEI